MTATLTRPPLHGDLDALAGYLATLPRSARDAAAEQVISHAIVADAHRRRHGVPHHRWGGGSVMAAVTGLLRGFPPRGDFCDPDFCDAVARAARALEALAVRSQKVAA